MYKVSGIEKLTESFTRTNLIGLTYYMKNFLPELIVYLEKRDKKMQIVSKCIGPNDGILFVEEVNGFTIPLKVENNFYVPVDDGVLGIKLDEADNIEYNIKDVSKLGADQVLFTEYFSIDIETKLALILNDEKLKKINYCDFVKKII